MPTHPLNKAYRPGAVDSAKVQQKIRITNNLSDFIKNFLNKNYWRPVTNKTIIQNHNKQRTCQSLTHPLLLN